MRPTLLRHYLQTLIGAHTPLKFIQEAGFAMRRPICKHVYTLESLPKGRLLPVSFTMYMGTLQRADHSPEQLTRVGYLNCDLTHLSDGQEPRGHIAIQGAERQWLHPTLQEAVAWRRDGP